VPLTAHVAAPAASIKTLGNRANPGPARLVRGRSIKDADAVAAWTTCDMPQDRAISLWPMRACATLRSSLKRW